MKSKRDLMAFAKQFIKFGIVGVLNTTIALVIYYIFIWINRDLYIVGNAVGFIISVMNAYYWNNKYVFSKKAKGNIKPLIRSFIVYGFTFLLSTGLLYFWVYIGISEIIAPLINLCITVPLNFIFNKLWAFK